MKKDKPLSTTIKMLVHEVVDPCLHVVVGAFEVPDWQCCNRYVVQLHTVRSCVVNHFVGYVSRRECRVERSRNWDRLVGCFGGFHGGLIGLCRGLDRCGNGGRNSVVGNTRPHVGTGSGGRLT